MCEGNKSKTITVEEYSELTNKMTDVIHNLLKHKDDLSATTAIKNMLEAHASVSELFRKGLSMNLVEKAEEN